MHSEFEKLRSSGTLTSENASQLAMRSVELILKEYLENKSYPKEAVTSLCQITANEDPAIARAGASALFPALIEYLNDSFEPEACALYDQIFANLIEFYRRLPQGKRLDEGLRSFGLMNESDLLSRKSRMLEFHASVSKVKKVLFLSRVTIGADVAVTSVIMTKLRDLLPNVEFVLAGSRKLQELFGGDAGLRVREIVYERGGSTLSRLMSWLEVVEAVEDEKRGLGPDEFWLIDPDSRLTQLGLLPLVQNDRNYFFFESRRYCKPGASRLGELASHWVDEVFGSKGPAFPYVALPREHRDLGQAIGEWLRCDKSSRLVTVNLGVGGNPRKRISDRFEEELISRLLEDSIIILDKGASHEERELIDRISAQMRAHGKTVLDVNERESAGSINQESPDLLIWEGGIGALAGLIAASDEYIGYDSAGQHIAAALRIPTLTIFVNSNSPTFAQRWSPYGPGEIEVLYIDAAELPGRADRALSEILRLRNMNLTQRRKGAKDP
jgi:Glycosyltransferase family 9 (heptosyltransferase)